jgi:beta-lactamase regulating signal transducer with metallopeptidase domain
MTMSIDLIGANLLAHWVQSGVIAVTVLIGLRALKITEPRLRLGALQGALVVLAVLPWVQPWQTIGEPLADSGAPAVSTAEASVVLPQGGIAERSPEMIAGGSVDSLEILMAVVVGGVALRLGWLVCGLASLSRFRRRARAVEVPAAAQDLEDQLSVCPRFVEHTGPGGPTTFGVLRPTIILPLNFASLDPVFQRSIVCHELLHVKRRDAAAALVEELIAAALWFHPWVWLMRSRIRVAREQVVDMGVVQLLRNRKDYVRCLVEMSGHELVPHLMPAASAASLSAGMLNPRELHSRVEAMFQEVRMSRTHCGSVAAMLAIIVGGMGWAGAQAMPLQKADLKVGATYVPTADVKAGAAQADIEPVHDAGFESARASGRNEIVAPTFRSAQTQDHAVAQEPGAGRERVEAALRVQEAALRMRDVTDAFAKAPQMPQADAPRPTVKVPFAEYPVDALEKGIHGTVHINLAISPAGDVTTATVIEGPQELRASALKAAYGLKYALASSTTTANIGVVYSQTAGSWGATIVHWQPKAPIASRDGTVFPDASGAYRVGGNLRQPRKI